MRVDAMAVRIPPVKGHPNRVDFEGVLTLVDAASDRAPAGAKGHKVLLTRAAAEAALPSLLGMAVDYRPGWDGHDAKRKIGLITEADVVGKKLTVKGYLYARDFPEATEAIRASAPQAMGMSYGGGCAGGGHAGGDMGADQSDLYRGGDSAAGQGGLPGDEFQVVEVILSCSGRQLFGATLRDRCRDISVLDCWS